MACLAIALAACSLDPGTVGVAETPAPATHATGPVPISPGDRSKLKPRSAGHRPGLEQRESDVRALIGKDETAVLSSLGEPSLRQEEPPARIWHYGTPACAVDLVFFFDMTSGEHRLALFRPAGGRGAGTDEVGCLIRSLPARDVRS